MHAKIFVYDQQPLDLHTQKRASCFCLLTWTWLSWPAWTWLSWPAWTVLLTGLFMQCWNRLFMAWWTNRLEQRCWNHHDKSTAIFIHDTTSVVREEWWNNKIEQRCQYNTYELGCCIKSGFACSNIRKPNSYRFAKLYKICWNVIEQYCYFTNPVLSC